MTTREEITFKHRISDLLRIYPQSDRFYREAVLKSMGDVDSLGYAKELIRLKQQAELLKSYGEANKFPEALKESDIDTTLRILQEKYGK